MSHLWTRNYCLCTKITKEHVEKFLEDFSLNVKIFGIHGKHKKIPYH